MLNIVFVFFWRFELCKCNINLEIIYIYILWKDFKDVFVGVGKFGRILL